MTDPASYRPAPGDIPTDPGVYRFRDGHGRVVYVGKARNLRARLNSYFADPSGLHPRTRSMVTTAASVDWVIVATEVEALALEYSWIKQYDPRFNVKYRDDKSYPYLAVTMSDAYPRAAVVREAKRKGTRYFGPYAHAWAIRDTLDQLVRVFPIRTCRDGVFRRATQVGRPCLLGYIDKCSAPCVGRIEPAEYDRLVDDFCAFMGGQSEPFVRSVERQMREASDRMEYEEAARLRDRLGALTRALERNAVVFDDTTDADVIGISEDDLQMGVQVFHVRGGRIRGERGFVVEKAEELTTSGYLERILQRLYADTEVSVPPREVLLSSPLDDPRLWSTWLSGLRGARVAIRTPQRGDKRALMATAVANAEGTLRLHTARRSGDLTTRSQALRELQDALALPEPPLRIECIDISTLQGQDTVASLVVFEDGLPRKRDYRSFVIRTEGADDTAAVAEVVTRRFQARGSGTGEADPPGPEATAADAQVADPGRDARGDRRASRGRSLRVSAGAVRGRRRGSAGACRPGRAHGGRHGRPAGDRPGEAAGGGVAARRGGPRDLAPDQRGAVSPAAGPRRGASHGHRAAPQAQGQAGHDQRAGLGARPRPGQVEGPPQALRVGPGHPGRLGGRAGAGAGDRSGAGGGGSRGACADR